MEANGLNDGFNGRLYPGGGRLRCVNAALAFNKRVLHPAGISSVR
jgi:hypothetical protein